MSLDSIVQLLDGDSVSSDSTIEQSDFNPDYYRQRFVPLERVLTINGVSYDLSVDRTWIVSSSFADQAANLVYAGPASGAVATPAFRALVSDDIPGLNASKITAGILAIARGSTGTSTVFTEGSIVFSGASGIYTQDNSNLFWDNTNNYLGIGINSSLNANLHIKGYGVGNTFNLIAQNSAGENILRVTNDGYVLVGDENNQGVAIYSGNGTNATVNTSPSVNKNLILMSSVSTIANGKSFIFKSQGGLDSASNGTTKFLSFDGVQYTNAQSVNNGFTAFEFNYEINQTAGGAGIHRGLYINPTLTSTTTTHRPIEVTSGDVWIGTTNGKLKIGTTASPQTQFATAGEFGFSGVSPSLAQTGWTISNPTTLRTIDVSTALLGDVRQVLGTLLQDLIDKGIILT